MIDQRARKEVGERDRCQADKTLNITSSLNISASITSGFHQQRQLPKTDVIPRNVRPLLCFD